MANVERPRHNRTEYQPWLGKYKGFLDGICIFHPKESIRLRTATIYNASWTRFLNQPKRLSKRKGRGPKG
jgi:hypothetical protein